MFKKIAKLKIIFFSVVALVLISLPAKADCWYNSSWAFRIPITIQAAQVSGSHTNFPVYLDLSDLAATNFFAQVRADGGDIRITMANGQTEVPRELVSINTGTSTGELHFLAPSVSGGETFYIYYGNAAATDYASTDSFGAENVWINNYLVVYHMQENPSTGTLVDSSSNSNDGTPQNMNEATVAGRVGQAYDFDGNNEYIATAIDGSENDEITVSTWFNNDDNNTSGNYIYDNSPGTTGYSSRLEGGTNKRLIAFTYTSGTADIATHGNTNRNTWYALTHTVDGTNVNIYVDGALSAANPQNATGIRDTSDTFEIARHSDNDVNGEFDGTIDELRISTVARAANWITTEYNNQNNPTAFWGVGANEANNLSTDWYGCDWKRRQLIRVEPAQVAGVNIDFPAYFDLSDLSATNFFNEVNSDGGDIRITSCDGTTELAREIVYTDTANGEGELHFLIPSMSGGEEFYIYYANPSAADYAITATFGAENVWSNYEGVWHLHQSPTGTILDSSSNSRDGTSIGAMNAADLVTGQFGNAIDFDGGNDGVNLGSSNNFTGNNIQDLSISLWSNHTSTTNAYTFSVKRDTANSSLISLLIRDSANGQQGYLARNAANSAHSRVVDTNGYNDGNWHHQVAVVNSPTRILYMDGANVDSDTDGLQSITGNTGITYIGCQIPGTRHYNGLVDEVRFSRDVKPASWVSSEYNNQNNPTAFWDLTVTDDVLTVISLTPPDNGAAASVTDNLEILFDQVPVLLNGDVIIRRLSDDSAFQTIDTNGTTFTVSGNGVSLRLPSPLFYNEYYYVELGCGAFGPVLGAPYVGFDDNGTWNFYSNGMEQEIDFFNKSFR